MMEDAATFDPPDLIYFNLAPDVRLALSRYAANADAGSSAGQQADDLCEAVRVCADAHPEFGEGIALFIMIAAIQYFRPDASPIDTARLVWEVRDRFPDGKAELIRIMNPPADDAGN